MKRQLFYSFIFLIFVCALTSCTSILKSLYGIREVKTVDEATILKYAKKYYIPTTEIYEIDTAYFSYLFSLDTVKFKAQIKNHIQPLQALYYDNKGYLISFQVNCYAGGFPNLKWDRNGIMTTFPPKQQAVIDSMVNLETQIKYLKPISQLGKINIETQDYVVIVYWNRFMGRQSKRLIRFVQENSMLDSGKKIKIIYANNDNIFARE